MNNQFATQFLLEDEELPGLENSFLSLGADEDVVQMFMKAIRLGLITPEKALEIVKDTLGMNEDGGSATGGGATNGASFSAGAGEQMTSPRAFKRMNEEGLNENRAYSQFKREAAIRNKPDQMHEAAKMINKRLEEVSRLLEFTSQMRSELSEGEQTLEYKQNTKKVFSKIHSKVLEVYSKIKSLK